MFGCDYVYKCTNEIVQSQHACINTSSCKIKYTPNKTSVIMRT